MGRFRGVSRNSNGGNRKWQARSYGDGSPRWLGNFQTEEEACRAVWEFENKQTRGRDLGYPDRDALDENLHNPILPTQTTKIHWRVGSEVSLRVAMLAQVQRDLKSPSPLVSKPARDWVRGLVNSPATFSFREICELCETDEKKARMSLLNS